MQGVVKLYDPNTGAGIVVSDRDRQEILLRAGTLRGSIFRTLRQGQRVVFDVVTEGDKAFASNIRLGAEGS